MGQAGLDARDTLRYFLDKYQEYFPDVRQAPLGFNVPVIYISNKGQTAEGEEAPALDLEKLSGNVLYYFDQQMILSFHNRIRLHIKQMQDSTSMLYVTYRQSVTCSM